MVLVNTSFFKHDLTALRRGVTILGEIIKQQLGETDAGSGHLNLVKAPHGSYMHMGCMTCLENRKD